MTQEKLKGRFDLLINPKLSKSLKISKFLNEPIAFHLHKNNQFFKKIDLKPDTSKTTQEVLQEIRKSQE
jgi:hypothetical protein